MRRFIAWIIAIGGVIFISWMYQGEATNFYGIAEATETTVSVQNAVDVIRVHVVPGQEVNSGDTLAELSRPDLTMRINEVSRELDALQGRTGLSTAGIDQRVAEVKADLQSRRNSLLFEIEKLKNELARNLELASKLKSLSSGSIPTPSGGDAMSLRIQSLERELEMVEQNAESQIKLLSGSRGLQHQSSRAEVDALQKEMELLLLEKKALTIISNGNWVVATVSAREGEKISSFNPILTLTRKSPSIVRGFIHEQVYNKISVGDSVEVRSSADPNSRMQGEVVGMGSRIVEFPERLRKVPEILVYGREVTIKIPEDNDFLLGEKTAIAVKAWKNIIQHEKSQAEKVISEKPQPENALPEKIQTEPVQSVNTKSEKPKTESVKSENIQPESEE